VDRLLRMFTWLVRIHRTEDASGYKLVVYYKYRDEYSCDFPIESLAWMDSFTVRFWWRLQRIQILKYWIGKLQARLLELKGG
jgi:hypothetical protein